MKLKKVIEIFIFVSGIILTLLLFTACSPTPLNEDAIAKIIPNEIKGQKSVESISIEKRQTNNKEDVVYTVIEMKSNEVHRTSYYILKINYYDKGGWILDEWEHYQSSTTYPLKPPSDDLATNLIKRSYRNYKLKSSSIDSFQSGSCSYMFDINEKHPNIILEGTVNITCLFDQGSEEWQASIQSDNVEMKLKPPSDNLAIDLVKSIYNNYKLKSSSVDDFASGSCSYMFIVNEEYPNVTIERTVDIICLFDRKSEEWKASVQSDNVALKWNIIGKWEGSWVDHKSFGSNEFFVTCTVNITEMDDTSIHANGEITSTGSFEFNEKFEDVYTYIYDGTYHSETNPQIRFDCLRHEIHSFWVNEIFEFCIYFDAYNGDIIEGHYTRGGMGNNLQRVD